MKVLGKFLLGVLMLTFLVCAVNVFADPNEPWYLRRTLGGSDDDEAFDIEQTSDGGYIIAASTRSKDGDVSGNHGLYDVWVVKLDKGGNRDN